MNTKEILEYMTHLKVVFSSAELEAISDDIRSKQAKQRRQPTILGLAVSNSVSTMKKTF